MADIKIDKNLFHERLSHLISAWKADKRAGDALFHGASSILVLMGKTEEAAQFQKNNAIHVRISKYSTALTTLSDVCDSSGCLGTSSQLLSSCSPSKDCTLSRLRRKVRYALKSVCDHAPKLTVILAKHLEPLKGGKTPLHVLVRGKDAEHNEKLFADINGHIKAAGVSHPHLLAFKIRQLTKMGRQKKVGILPKDTSIGPFIDEWKKAFGSISKDVEEVDISAALSSGALAVKDENELVGRTSRDLQLRKTDMLHSVPCEMPRKLALPS